MKPVYDSLIENGQEFGIGHFGTFVVNTFRIEKGFKMWGNEMNCDGSILEAGLEAFVRWKKPSNFLGKDALTQQLSEWRNQKLTMLEVENAQGQQVDPEGNESVWLCGRVRNRGRFSFCGNNSQTLIFLGYWKLHLWMLQSSFRKRFGFCLHTFNVRRSWY